VCVLAWFCSIPAQADLLDPPAGTGQSAASVSVRAPVRALALPPLGNTALIDRPLMREIGDDHVHVPRSVEPSSPATAPRRAHRNTPPDTVAAAPPAPASEPSLTDPALADPVLAGPSPSGVPATPLDDTGEAAGPWTRIRGSTRWPASERDEVLAFREQFEREALYVDRMLLRANVFIDHLVDRLDARFLPLELALLPAIESGFRSDVISRGHAAGLWQIVPVTATEIGLQRTAWFDGRADTVASTTAAIDYLSYLNAEFHGDWELTLAAYNAGPGRVRRAIKRNESLGEPSDFWSLKLPLETREYVPKLLALVDLLKAEDSVLTLPSHGESTGFERVEVGFRIGLAKAAELAGVPEAELDRLNAGLLHGVTAPRGPHRLYLPATAVSRFRERLADIDGEALFSLPMQHRVVKGDTLGSIAIEYGMRTQRLMELNGLDDTRIRIGQSLNVIDTAGRHAAEIEYVVSIGDTLSRIAQEHSVQPDAIRDAGGDVLDDDLIHPGEILKIVVPLGTTG